MDDTEDLPLRYLFNTKDMCTGWVRKLPAPAGNDNSITALLFYDLEGLCERGNHLVNHGLKPGNRSVVIFGAVKDRYGSKIRMCKVIAKTDADIKKRCPRVSLAPQVDDIEPTKMIEDAQELMKDNKLTSLQAVDQISVAMKIRRGQKKNKNNSRKKIQTEQDRTQRKDETDEKVDVLNILESAASEVLEDDAEQTSRAQAQIMDVIASTVTDDAVTDEVGLGVADKALQVTGVTVGRLGSSNDVEETEELVKSAVAVFGGVSQYLSPVTQKSMGDVKKMQTNLRRNLKARADMFCDALTTDTQPGDTAMGSVEENFVFNCQKAMVRPGNQVAGAKNNSRVTFEGFQSISRSINGAESIDGAVEQHASPPLDIVLN